MSEQKRQNISIESIEGEQKEQQPKRTSGFNEKNYLNVKLKKGENSKELRIRLLPIDKDSSSPFKTIWMHTVQVDKEISPNTPWKSYVCLNKTEDIDHEHLGDKCPFCELNHDAFVKRGEAQKAGNAIDEKRWQDISLANKPSEVCVMRCIERGAEADGPKFWKVNVRTDEKDPKSLITKLVKDRYKESIEVAKDDNGGELPEDFEPQNILDIYNGKDLKLTITRNFTKDGQPTDKTTISVVDYGHNKPLSEDDEQIEKWINDEKVWSDVFVAKPYDYLSIIIEGGVPFYDKENKKWIPKIKKNKEEEAEIKAEATREADKKIEAAEKKALEYEEPVSDGDNEPEELPF